MHGLESIQQGHPMLSMAVTGCMWGEPNNQEKEKLQGLSHLLEISTLLVITRLVCLEIMAMN